jgi:RNA polymerase sigma-70 factor (ECF subfamily)
MAGILKLDEFRAGPGAAGAGDLGEIVGRFQTPLLRYVGGIVNRDEDAQDVVQEVFLCYCRFSQRGDAEPVKNASAWLFSVAHNLSQDVLRKRQRDKKAQSELAADPAPAETSEGEAVDTIIRQAASERALAELRKLPEEYRQVLLLKIVQEMTLRDIAKVTGLSFGNVAYRLNQGLKELARRLKEAGVL